MIADVIWFKQMNS